MVVVGLEFSDLEGFTGSMRSTRIRIHPTSKGERDERRMIKL